MCDSMYAQALASVWDDSTFDYALWDNKHNNLFNFDSAAVCVRSGFQNADSCCGNYSAL